MAWAMRNADAPDPDKGAFAPGPRAQSRQDAPTAPGRRSAAGQVQSIAGGLTFAQPAAAAPAPKGGQDEDPAEEDDGGDGSPPPTTTDLLESMMPVVSILWAVVLIGILLNLLLLCCHFSLLHSKHNRQLQTAEVSSSSCSASQVGNAASFREPTLRSSRLSLSDVEDVQWAQRLSNK